MVALTATLVTATSASAWPTPPPSRHQCSTRPVPALCELHWWIRVAHRDEHARGLPRTRYWYSAERNPLEAPWLAQRKAWRYRAQRIGAISLDPWTGAWFRDALCVHHYEGAWNADTGNGYYGGMQMDAGFEAAYGAEFVSRWGNADLWPPRDQLIASYRAWTVRGWSPWPVSSVECGL